MDNIEKVYNHIKEFIKEKGFPPSAKQIAEELKMDYHNEVSPAIDNLKEKGKIIVENTKERVVKLID